MACACADGFTLAERGKPAECRIVVPNNFGTSYFHAAEELQHHVKLMTGVELPVVPRWKGTGAVRLEMPPKELGEEGFRICVKDGDLHVIGGKRGILYGVYELLETYGGCGWFASWRTVVPEHDSFKVPDTLDDTQKPAFLLRESDWQDFRLSTDLAVRNRINDCGMRPKALHGGPAYRFVRSLGNAHTFETLVPSSVWFDSHPEYFSEVNGVRRKGRTQLCLTNPDVLRIVVSEVLAHIKADERIVNVPCVDIVGVSQNDWANYCTCHACKEIDDREESHAGSLLQFINKVAEEVERQSPGVYVETLIYEYTRKPPKTLKPRHNVIPCLCSIECSFSHPLVAKNLPANAEFMHDLEIWGKLSENLYVWDYTTDYNHFLYPMPDVLTLQPNMQTFRDNGVKFLFEEGGPSHADFAPLKGWLIAKLMWNPDQPVEPLLDTFFTGYYGMAAPYVRRYFDRVEHILRDDPRSWLTIWDDDRPSVFTDAFLDESIALFDLAEAAVKDDPVLLLNVRAQAMVPLCVKLDRRGAKAKYIWVTRHPDRFPDCADMLPLIKRIKSTMAAFEAAGRGRVEDRLAISVEKSKRSIDMWSHIESFARPAQGCDMVTVGVKDMYFRSNAFGRIVTDETALDGTAIEANNRADKVGAAWLFFGNVAADADANYVVRFHARVDRAPEGKGEAFDATYAGERIAPRVEDVPDGWQWYTFKPQKINGGQTFSFASGRFANGGGRGAVKGVRIDRIEISRLATSATEQKPSP
jgi:hypothetical protein